MSIKKLLLLIISISLFVCPIATKIESKNLPLKEKVIFLWDIHGVILNVDMKKMAHLLWHDAHFSDILRHMDRSLFFNLIKLSVKSIGREGLGEDFIHLANKYNNPHLAELIIKASNTQKPIQGTVDIIQELHNLHYTQHIGSNISATTFCDLIDEKKYPAFSPIFRNFSLNESQVVHYDKPLIKKPNQNFFVDYLIRNNIDLNNTTVIFIDNIKANVNAARKVGIVGIQFKSPQQLRRSLLNMGIPLTREEPIIKSIVNNYSLGTR